MRDDMYEGRWSPFDPKWYSEAFDKYISTADRLFNQELIIEQGYNIPDADGSKSTVFRNDAVLNNSFNENDLRSTLTDIYNNSTLKMISSNHDNTGFYQWTGTMENVEYIANTNQCELTIPTDTFINPEERDKFKLSQFFRKWIKIEELMNNWDILKWCCLLFINKKIYSEYELHMDDREVKIRFKYNDYWVKNNFPIYVYKFNTNYQKRVLISRELCKNQWDWKMPISYIDDHKISNYSSVLVTFNKISDQTIRTDGITGVDILGDNIEFLKIKDGYIDLSDISKFNKILIESESKEWIWMSIIVPKFFNEYPILLPIDSIYRPYVANFQPVVTMEYNRAQYVKTNTGEYDKSQVYIDANNNIEEVHYGWNDMIRPIVLSDAYDNPQSDIYDLLNPELDNLRDRTVEGADLIEEFHFFILENYTGTEKFNQYLDDLKVKINNIRSAMHEFMDKRQIEYNEEFEDKYDHFLKMIEIVRSEGYESEYFHTYQGATKDFWNEISPLIYIARNLADKYYISRIIHSMRDKQNVWSSIDTHLNSLRFQRPIDESDFWIFEYDINDEVWRPAPLSIERKFPDVYLLKDPDKDNTNIHRLFKAFFFYSDTMSVRNESIDINRPTASWTNDLEEFHINNPGSYRDIFMEKFYWMGVRAIYKGLLLTKARWESIEYVIDNNSYERFNELFIHTMDPYFKLGLATYLKSDNFEFPFDDAISKMEEAINSKWLNYKKVTNFEIYLNKNWIPSYFDYIAHITDDYEYEGRLLRRPRISFNIDNLIPNFKQIQYDTNSQVNMLNDDIQWILNKLSKEKYNLTIENFTKLMELAISLKDESNWLMSFIADLDMQILSNDDINRMIESIKKYYDSLTPIEECGDIIYKDANDHNVYEKKLSIIREASERVEGLSIHINNISQMIQTFDMDGFMKSINNLRSYFKWDKDNPDDNSLIGKINKFDDPWANNVKDARNKLFVSTSELYGIFDPSKSYTPDEVSEFMKVINEIKDDINNLKENIISFWNKFNYETDQEVIDKLDIVSNLIEKLIDHMNQYSSFRSDMVDDIDQIKELLLTLDQYDISTTEINIRNNINDELYKLLLSLSYIAGKNNRNDAINYLTNSKRYLLEWNEFIADEQEVFERIFNLSAPPINIIGTLIPYGDILNAFTVYMNSVNDPYIPDSSWATYSDVYTIDEIEMINYGFNYAVGDDVFIPSLGSYRITEISDDSIAKGLSIDNLNYIGTMYRDPLVQQTSYDTISSGDGMGIIVKALKSTRHIIINDQPTETIITRIRNIGRLASKDIDTVNPYYNSDLKMVLSNIDLLIKDWERLKSRYGEHMTTERVESIEKLITILNTLYDECNDYIDHRKKVDVRSLVGYLTNYIDKSYEYIESIDKHDANFFYYDNMIREALTKLEVFYGNGSGWNDGTELNSILDEIKVPINTYHKMIYSDEAPDNIKSLYDSMVSLIPDIIAYTGDILPADVLYINPLINDIENKSNELLDQESYSEELYRINSIGLAVNGTGYRIGDIVELIPNENGLNGDTILLEVTDAEDGNVRKIKPLLDYATSYKINGIYNTKTRVGKGENLKVNIKGSKLTIFDSTLLVDDNSVTKKFPMFNENDLFVYKFENIHDLAIEYDVFLGGKQINDFYRRHLSDNNELHPRNIDLIYINANTVMDLQNSSLYIPEDHYFIYRIDDISIKDPGAGYAVGQTIYADTGSVNLSLKVKSLDDTPYKGIGEIDISDTTMIYNDGDPSCENAEIITDSLNNIDDEYNNGYYAKLTSDGIIKPLTKSYPIEKYKFRAKRFDDVIDGNMNKTFMYPDINITNADTPMNGDPDDHYYLGSRIDNSMHPMKSDRRHDGIANIISPLNPIIKDDRRVPTSMPIKGDYQFLQRMRIHNSEGITNNRVNEKYESSIINAAMIEPDLSVPTYADLPRHTIDYPDGKINRRIVVECDETHDNHRMLYRIRSFVASGFFVYDEPEIADYAWDKFTVDWMSEDSYRDYPSNKAIYQSDIWNSAKTCREVEEAINDGKIEQKFSLAYINPSTYISDLSVTDLSVYNHTTNSWEDLHDENKWKLEVTNDDENKVYGFTLTYTESGNFSYDMSLYLNKIPDNQLRNEELKRNAIIDVAATIIGEVNTPSLSTPINTGRDLRIRKLFPYYQKEEFVIGYDNGTPLGYEMNFKLAPYMHFKNELQLADVMVFNKTAGRFEDLLDPQLFEVRFKDDKSVQRGWETQTKIVQSIISKSGEGFVDGDVWAYNAEFGIHVFGQITADILDGGKMIRFTPIHCPNPPKEDIALAFDVYQTDTQTERQMGIVIIQFTTEKIEVFGDGYIHNVQNPYAPLPKEFKIIAQYDLDSPNEYEVIIDKSPMTVEYRDSHFKTNPVIKIEDRHINGNRIYIMTDNGRYPLINPSTNRPTFKTEYTDSGTKVTFLNLYNAYEHLQVKVLPYPQRSVYTQRNIPKSGYIDLNGKINKPLNKKYFEFWVNGRLLNDEVTIITPTKIFLHGLQSLKNLEIIEINRDPNEYFSDAFLSVEQSDLGRPYHRWFYDTYLDDALEGTLDGDNYTEDEQEYLLSPVWKQVERDHPEFKNYPPNMDNEDDILLRISIDSDQSVDNPLFQFMILDPPTLEGKPVFESNLSFEHFGFKPITDQMIVDMFNEEWAKEIEDDNKFPEFVIVSEDEWYGMPVRMYDEYGILVNNLNLAAYKVPDNDVLRINTETRISQIVRNKITYDLD